LLLLPGEVLVSVLEERLTALGRDVLITRSQKPEVWRSLLHAGFTVLVPSKLQAQPEIIMLGPDANEFQRKIAPRPSGLKEQVDVLLEQLKQSGGQE